MPPPSMIKSDVAKEKEGEGGGAGGGAGGQMQEKAGQQQSEFGGRAAENKVFCRAHCAKH